jgi:DNA-binding MarR family transcriptional regulator
MKTPIDSGLGACACTTLRKASRAVSRLYEDRFVQTGMTITQFSVLRALDRQPDQPLSRLAEAMVMDRTSLYRLIAPLEREGFLKIAAGSGRARIASMTQQGRAAMDRAAPVWDAAQSAFLEQFGRMEWAQLEAILAKVVVSVEGVQA